MKPRLKRRARRGFTVVEVMMALVVLTLGGVGVIAMQKAVLIGNINARNMATANGIAQAWVERIRADAQSWNDQGNVPDINQTAWLSAATAAPPTNGGGWFVPNSMNYLGSQPAGAASHDIMGADLLRAADITKFGTAFCTQVRLTRFANAPTGQLSNFYKIVRIEVRVMWDRTNNRVNCASLPAGWDTDFGHYGSVYVVASAMQNKAPY